MIPMGPQVLGGSIMHAQQQAVVHYMLHLQELAVDLDLPEIKWAQEKRR